MCDGGVIIDDASFFSPVLNFAECCTATMLLLFLSVGIMYG